MRTSMRGGAVLGMIFTAATCLAARPADDVSINVVRLSSGGSGGAEFNRGYTAARMEVANSSQRTLHEVELRMGGYGQRGVSQSFKLAPGASSRLMWVAPMLRNNGYMTALVDGEQKSMGSSVMGAVKGYFPGSPEPCLLVSRRVEFDPFDDKLNTATAAVSPVAPGVPPAAVRRGYSPSSPTKKAALFRAEMESNAWFGDPLAYSCYDAVILAPDDWAKIPPDVRDALTRYTECGGTVVVFDKGEPPAGWETALNWVSGGFRIHQVGFGRWILIPKPGSRSLTDPDVRTLRSLLEQQRFSADDVSRTLGGFTVVPNVSVPIGGISLFIVSFVLMAGPVNLFLVIRRKKRLWLLWTTPLLGILFSGALILYFFLSEGVSARGRIQAVTLLNETTKRATTLAVDGVYCPIPPRDGLVYGNEWEVAWKDNSRGYGPNSTAGMFRLGAVQQLDGFVSARVPFAASMRGSRHAAERLPVTVGAGGVVEVVNGLGAALKTLRVVLPDGREFAAGAEAAGPEIAAGAKARLVPAAAVKTASTPLANIVTRCGWVENVLPDRIALQNGWYVAELSRAVFAQKGLPCARYQERQIVIGVMPVAKGGAQ